MEKIICSSRRQDMWIQSRRSPSRTRRFKTSSNKLTTAPPRPTSTSTKVSSSQRANSSDLIHFEFLPSVVRLWQLNPGWVMEKALSKSKATKLRSKTWMTRIGGKKSRRSCAPLSCVIRRCHQTPELLPFNEGEFLTIHECFNSGHKVAFRQKVKDSPAQLFIGILTFGCAVARG